MDINKAEDPRTKSNRYLKGTRAKFDKDQFDFSHTQFLIDSNYIGDPPDVQVSIANLNDNIDEKFLMHDFSTKLGKVKTLEIVRHPNTKEHLGLAKVQFEEVKVARLCVENYDGKVLMGRRLNVFKDLRYAKIEELKVDKLQPRPLPLALQKPPTALPSLTALQATIQVPNIQTNHSLHPHPHINAIAPILPPLQQHLQKPNSVGVPPIPSPLSLEYPTTTPCSIGSSTTPTSNSTPDLTSGRLYQRLDDRIASLKKKPNCLLSNLVAPAVPQVSPTYSSFNLNETNYDYANSSYYQSQSSVTLKVPDKLRPELSNHRRLENNYQSNHYQNNKEPHQKYETSSNNRSDRYSSDHSSEERSNEFVQKKEEPVKIELNEKLIEEIVLPYCYPKFYKELEKNLLETIFKKLRETYGYQCLEKAQQAHRAKLEEKKKKEDQEKLQLQLARQMETKWLSKARAIQPVEAPKPRVQILRERHSLPQDDRRRDHTDFRRVNRSSAYVADPDRRGSHNTSIDSDLSDSDSSSASSSSSSRSSSSQSSFSSRSSSVSSSRSQSPSSYSSHGSFSIEHSGITSRIDHKQDSTSTAREDSNVNDEAIATAALLSLSKSVNEQSQDYNDLRNKSPDFMDDSDEIVRRPPKTAGKKRKKGVEFTGVASEYRSAKRFASDSSHTPAAHDENIENALGDDENLIETKHESRFAYQPRIQLEKERMLNDLYGTLTEEDVEFLKSVHEKDGYRSKLENQANINIPFGSDNANKAHLYLRKHMIEGKATEGHPKWWRGCSRCDVIEISETEKIENEELNYEDLTKAPIKSHVIQAANSSRRDQRGDQRRIAALNANLDAEFIKMYTTNTLQVSNKTLKPNRLLPFYRILSLTELFPQII